MNTFYKRILLWVAVYSLVVLFDTPIVFAVPEPSLKVKVEQVYADTAAGSYTVGLYAASRSLGSPIGYADVHSVLLYAKKFIGVKYRYGASGPYSFDCSGFTMHVMGKFGIKLPHSARDQSEYGTVISREDLKPGDLVYFDTSKGKGISHVGIYVGDGSFIHAASKGVGIASLEEGYYERRYVMATRVIR